ncbi:hypothetical protein VUR80DRAFT_3564 [Thermomyces stellatus]
MGGHRVKRWRGQSLAIRSCMEQGTAQGGGGESGRGNSPSARDSLRPRVYWSDGIPGSYPTRNHTGGNTRKGSYRAAPRPTLGSSCKAREACRARSLDHGVRERCIACRRS